MKMEKCNKEIQIFDENVNFSSFINEIANSDDGERSFLVCDLGKIVEKCSEWSSVFPNISAYYAVKCNDNEQVLKTLAALGLGFDCASRSEIDKILSMKVNPNRIIYAHPAKPITYIQHARKAGVKKMTFDNESELHKIQKYHPNSELVLRFRCDDMEAEVQLGLKFGCDPNSDALELLKIAKKLNLNVVGVCFHVGSNSKDPCIFLTALNFARSIFDFAKTLDYNFTVLDIGGGFPGIRGTSIEKYAEVIHKGLKKYFSDLNVDVISEPGRFFVASSCTLATNIISIRPIIEKNGSSTIKKKNMYYLNDGCYGSFGIYFRQHIKIIVEPLKKPEDDALIKSTLWGPTCESYDKVADAIMLPQMNVNDWLIFHDMGAYTLPAVCNFNGFQSPNIYVVVKESTWLALKNSAPFKTDDFVRSHFLVDEFKL